MLLFTSQSFITSSTTSFIPPQISPQEAISGDRTSFGEVKKDLPKDKKVPGTITGSNVLPKTTGTLDKKEETTLGQVTVSSSSSSALRQYLRAPLIHDIFDYWQKFGENIEKPEGGLYYSKLRESVDKIWNFISPKDDENLSQAITIINSVVNERSWLKWKNNDYVLMSEVLKKLLHENVSVEENEKAVNILVSNKIEVFPTEDDEKEQEIQKEK